MFLLNTNNFVEDSVIIVSVDKSASSANCVAINELILLDKNENKITYTINPANSYDSVSTVSGKRPYYWTNNGTSSWDYGKLYDNNTSYGSSYSTVIIYNTKGAGWCEFCVSLSQSIENLGKIQLYLCSNGGSEGNRDLALFNFYTPLNKKRPKLSATRFSTDSNAKLLGTINNTVHVTTPTLFSIDI